MSRKNKNETEQLDGEDLVYYTHPSGKVEEMKRSERDALENPVAPPELPAPSEE